MSKAATRKALSLLSITPALLQGLAALVVVVALSSAAVALAVALRSVAAVELSNALVEGADSRDMITEVAAVVVEGGSLAGRITTSLSALARLRCSLRTHGVCSMRLISTVC